MSVTLKSSTGFADPGDLITLTASNVWDDIGVTQVNFFIDFDEDGVFDPKTENLGKGTKVYKNGKWVYELTRHVPWNLQSGTYHIGATAMDTDGKWDLTPAFTELEVL